MQMLQVVPLLLLAVSVLLSCCGRSYAYPEGPPDSACVNMFPSGHHSDAQSSSPPYELAISNSTTLTGGAQLSVTLQVKTGSNTNYKGVFVQARLADDCTNTKPQGTFSLPSGSDSFLKLMNCGGISNSAVSQSNDNTPQTTKTFTWTAPTTIPGTIYFRATVVNEEHTFWTNVFSSMMKPVNVTSNLQPCAVQTTAGASPTSATRLVTAIVSFVVIALLL